MVAEPLEHLQLLADQDMVLVCQEELLTKSIWSTQLGTDRRLVDGLLEVMQQVLTNQYQARLSPKHCLRAVAYSALVVFQEEAQPCVQLLVSSGQFSHGAQKLPEDWKA
jgi:hypothetical protein